MLNVFNVTQARSRSISLTTDGVSINPNRNILPAESAPSSESEVDKDVAYNVGANGITTRCRAGGEDLFGTFTIRLAR